MTPDFLSLFNALLPYLTLAGIIIGFLKYSDSKKKQRVSENEKLIKETQDKTKMETSLETIKGDIKFLYERSDKIDLIDISLREMIIEFKHVLTSLSDLMNKFDRHIEAHKEKLND